MGRLRRLGAEECGIALVVALGVMIVMAIAVTGVISYTTGNGHDAARSAGRLQGRLYAEGGVNYTQAILQKELAGGNPAAANLLGCDGAGGAADTTGPSNCSAPSPKTLCFRGTSCTAGSPDSASVYGYYSGTTAQTYLGRSLPASTWLIVSTGYASDPAKGGISATTVYGRVHVRSADAGAVAAVWNHLFITSPLVANQCAVDFGGNGMHINTPLYAIGNVCLSGNNTTIEEAAGGQPVDLMVGGKLVLSGSGTKAGTDSTHKLTSGVVVGGCTTVSVSSSTSPCDNGHFNYWVSATDTFVPAEAPEMLAADIANDYAKSDPGPNHACASGGLPATTFDNDTTQNGTNATFELLPGSSYTCVSQSGAGVGQLTWNNATKTLTIAGNVFLDGNLTISQSGTYAGTGVIEAAGTIAINGNGTSLCATSPCSFTNWQGSSGNNAMLTLVSLKPNATSLTFVNNNQTFQGSVWLQPSSAMTFVKNGVTVEGPMSIGKFDNTFNNATFKPLPVIENMPVGAPVPPNISVTLDPVAYED